jgi:hypothetical protein
MRQSGQLRAGKDFITNYHINEVPLPYYNPLEDPHLRGFFNSHKISSHISRMGFLYSPSKHYPYHERRARNAYKFLKKNCNEVPPTHVLSHSMHGEPSSFSSRKGSANDSQFNSQVLAKRSSDGEMLRQSKRLPQLEGFMTERPSTKSINRRSNKS